MTREPSGDATFFIASGIDMSTIPAGTDAPPVIGPDCAGVLLTPDEFDAITKYDDGFRYELIRGVLVVAPVPAEADAPPNDELGAMLRQYQREHPQGAALDETIPERFVRTSTGRRRADRVVWTGLGRRPDPTTDVPAIVIEFVSSSRRDRRRDYEEKRREYLEAGVVEYWIVDRFRRRMTVYRNTSERENELVVAEQDNYQTILLPGFELPLERLLAVADRWA
jgi:Uma2 family endonuclease